VPGEVAAVSVAVRQLAVGLVSMLVADAIVRRRARVNIGHLSDQSCANAQAVARFSKHLSVLPE
jgi:hypothetical protein